MNIENIIKGNSENEVWQKIDEQFLKNPDPLEYTTIIEQQNRRIVLHIDIDLGGGFESGYETTTLTAPLSTSHSFRFGIHEEHFTDEIGKFFGMQDVVIGFPEFDKKLIIKTNDESKVREIFANVQVRQVFESLNDFTFGITHHHATDTGKTDHYLELTIESGITDVTKLREIYNAFFSILLLIDPS